MTPLEPTTLRWPSVGPGRYRVVVRAPGAASPCTFVTDQPELRIDPSALPGEPESLTWKVQHAPPRGTWTDYLPAMSWPTTPAGPTSELTWIDDGAAAHRVVVYDDTDERVALTAATAEREYLLDWSRLEAGHRYRWRIQSWVGGRWEPLTAYEPLRRCTLAPLNDERWDPDARRTWLAYAHLDAGRPREALRTVGEAPEGASSGAQAIALVARALSHEQAGDAATAAECFDAAYALGVPLAAVLRECARHYERRERYDRAFHCHALLDATTPGTLRRFVARLPASEQLRHTPLIVPEMLRAERPRLYAVAPHKRALTAGLGEAGAALALGAFANGVPLAVARASLTSLLEHAAAHALEFHEVSAPRDVTMASAPIFGAPRPPGISGRTRSFFTAVLEDAVVTSKSNLLLAGNRVLMDFQEGEREQVPVDLDVDPLVAASDGTDVSVMVHEESDRAPTLGEALSLVGVHTYNFGHFVFEQLFKVLANLDRPGFAGVPLLVDERMPAQLRELLEFVVGAEHPVTVLPGGASVAVSRLWASSLIAYWPAGDLPGTVPGATAELADVPTLLELIAPLERRFAPLERPEPTGRLYLTRRGRRLANRTAVEAWFDAQGFEVVDFADLPFVEQATRLRNAEVVVVEDGSAVYGLLFARRGVRIGVLTVPPGAEYEWCNEMFTGLGHRLLLMTGELTAEHPHYANMSDFTIDVARLPAFLDELAALP